MSPRAAWRLETMGFEQIHDYVGGKADWLANGLPRAGASTAVPYAGELVDSDPPTCGLSDTVADVRARLDGARDGFCLVLNVPRILLGRVRRRALDSAAPTASIARVMEPGPSTVRFNTPASELAERLAAKNLKTAIVTTPNGCLVGVFHRADAEAHIGKPRPS